MPVKALKKIKKEKLKRKTINEKLDVLTDDFKGEIKDFEHFCELQKKKILIIKNIRDIWQKRWKKAEFFLKKEIPRLIHKQKKFLEAQLKAIQEEDFLLNQLILTAEEEKTKTSTLPITSPFNQEQREIAIRLLEEEESDLRRILVIHTSNLVFKIKNLMNLLEFEQDFLKKENCWELIWKKPSTKIIIEEDKYIQNINNLIKEEIINDVKKVIEEEQQRLEREKKKREYIQKRIDEEKNILLKRLYQDDSVETRKLRIMSELYEFYKNPVKKEIFVQYLKIIKTMNDQLIATIESKNFKKIKKKPELETTPKIESLVEILQNQNQYIKKILKNIETGRFYFRYFMLKNQKTSLTDLPKKYNFNKIFFALINLIREEFGEYKKSLKSFYGEKLFLEDIYTNRTIPYWSNKNLSSVYSKMQSIIHQHISISGDLIFEEEVFFDNAMLNRIPKERKKRILAVFEKVNRLFLTEMQNRPIGGNILFHTTGLLNLQEMIKDGAVSSKYEKKYLSGETIPGGQAFGSVGISFNFNIGAHFVYIGGKGTGAGGIFMIPMNRALRHGYILKKTESGTDPFEILLVHKQIDLARRYFEGHKSIDNVLGSFSGNFLACKAFYTDENGIKTKFFSQKVDIDFQRFILEIIGQDHLWKHTFKPKVAEKIKYFSNKFNLDPEIFRTVLWFLKSPEDFGDKEPKISKDAKKALNNALKDNEFNSFFKKLYDSFQKDAAVLKQYLKLPFGKFFLLHKDLQDYRYTSNSKKAKYSFLFYEYVAYIHSLGGVDFSRLISGSKNKEIKSKTELEALIKSDATGLEALNQLILYILSDKYNNKPFEELSVEEVEDILYKDLPALFHELRVSRVGYLETRIFIKDTILLLPKSKFSFWESFFRKAGQRPFITLYFDASPDKTTHTTIDGGKIDMGKIENLQQRVLIPLLNRCGINFKPMFTKDYDYKRFIENKYFEGTEYNPNGDCVHYELKESS